MNSSAATDELNPPPTPIAYLSRRYRFSASHRLHAGALSDEDNRDVYGKCNNPYGHGHNYTVEVTFGGPINAATGMVCDLAALDAFARTNLLDAVDHMNLNTLQAFQDLVPTTENLTIEIHRIFTAFTGARLVRVYVEETSNNFFEYPGPLPGRLN